MNKNPHNLSKEELDKLAYRVSTMQAYQHGKLLEESFIEINEWTPSVEPEWDWSQFNYRIASVQEHTKPSELISTIDDTELDELPAHSQTTVKLKIVTPEPRVKPSIKQKVDINKLVKTVIKSIDEDEIQSLDARLKQIDYEYENKLNKQAWGQFFSNLFKTGN